MIVTIPNQLGKELEVLDTLSGKRTIRERIAEDTEYIPDLEYARLEGRALKLDLLKPRERQSGRLPALIYLHGGGWNSGNHRSVQPLFYAMSDYVRISVDYRLAGEAAFPAQIQDCKTAVRWLRANADELGVDPDRIGVWGSSAGGHLALLLAVTEGISEFEGEELPGYSSKVQAVASSSGPVDLLEMWDWKEVSVRSMKDKVNQAIASVQKKLGPAGSISGKILTHVGNKLMAGVSHDALERLMGGVPQDNGDWWELASPVHHVETRRDMPFFLLMHGTTDPLVPVSQAYQLHEALRTAGADVVFTPLKGHGHNIFWDHNKNFKREHAAYLLQFFNKHLQMPASRT